MKTQPEITARLTINRGIAVFHKESVQNTRYEIKNRSPEMKSAINMALSEPEKATMGRLASGAQGMTLGITRSSMSHSAVQYGEQFHAVAQSERPIYDFLRL